MITKLDIFPSFEDACVFQLIQTPKSNSLHFTIKKKFNEFLFLAGKQDLSELSNPKTWKVEVNAEAAEKIILLTEEIIQNPHNDNRLILDGVMLTCAIAESDNSEIKKEHTFKCPEDNTNELKLVWFYFELANELIKDAHFTNYFELIEGYFYSKLHCKEFEGQPYRFRMYGGWTISEKEALTEILLRLSQKPELLIDMTNFRGMGTALYACFQPLFCMKNVRFVVNEGAYKQVKEMGFKGNVFLLLE